MSVCIFWQVNDTDQFYLGLGYCRERKVNCDGKPASARCKTKNHTCRYRDYSEALVTIEEKVLEIEVSANKNEIEFQGLAAKMDEMKVKYAELEKVTLKQEVVIQGLAVVMK